VSKIEVKKPADNELETLGVFSWPIWEKEPSVFPWHYDEKETCYLLSGKVTVRAEGEEISFGAGDMVTFPEGLDCEWDVSERVKKHYKFG